MALACAVLALALTGPADAKKKRKQSIAGTYTATTDDYGGYTVSLNVSRSGVVSPFQLQMVVYGEGCGASRLVSIPAPIKLKRVTRSKLEGEYNGMDSNGIDKLWVLLKLRPAEGEIHGLVRTERVVNPIDDWACVGRTAFDAKRK